MYSKYDSTCSNKDKYNSNDSECCPINIKRENTIVIYSDFNEAVNMQKYLEDNGFEIQSMEFVRIPNDTKELTDEQRESVQKLIDKIEEDEDVQNVFTNMAE